MNRLTVLIRTGWGHDGPGDAARLTGIKSAARGKFRQRRSSDSKQGSQQARGSRAVRVTLSELNGQSAAHRRSFHFGG